MPPIPLGILPILWGDELVSRWAQGNALILQRE
jgi:hypothetical protein